MATFSDFKRLYKSIDPSRVCVASEAEAKREDGYVILKHDIECKVKKAYRLCLLESLSGLRGTYYVQHDLLKDEKNVALLKIMRSLGAEICYHHEVMDEASGDIDKATDIFEQKLSDFEGRGFEISTVCQHGNPTVTQKSYLSNRDFFRADSVRKRFESTRDIMVNFSEKAGSFTYISDHGYKWKIIPEPENDDKQGKKAHIVLDGFDSIGAVIKNDKRVIISIHTHRIASTHLTEALSVAKFNLLRTIAKILMRIPLLKKILARRYRLARKV